MDQHQWMTVKVRVDYSDSDKVLDSDSAAARFKEKDDEVAMFDVRMLARNIGDLIIIKNGTMHFHSYPLHNSGSNNHNACKAGD